MRTPLQRSSVILGTVGGVVLLFASSASAARLLQVFIEHEGVVVAHTYYDDNGRADAATVWRYLETPPIMVDDDVTAINATVPDLEARLTGEVLIRFQHVDRVIAQARLSTLALRRSDGQTQRWFLSRSEAERTAKIAGLGSPSTFRGGVAASTGVVALAALAILVLFGAVVSFLLSRRARGPGPK